MNKLFFILLAIPLFGHGQLSYKLDNLFKSEQSNEFNGNVLYSKNDTIIFTGNYGFANYETKQGLNDSTLFNLASCSKQFTALAIVQLVEKKKINYDTSIDELIDSFPYRGITIEHLLTHTSGLPDYMEFDQYSLDKSILTNNDVLAYLAKYTPEMRFVPGTQFEYSNTGYLLLASVIEKISGLTFGTYLKENIFAPANMNNSRVLRRRFNPEKINNNS